MSGSLELREYALLANVPVIYCLYYTNQSSILGKWVHQWLIDFARDADPPAFHPFTLQLIREKLPNWRRILARRNDYELFLEGVFGAARISAMDKMISDAIEMNRVLFYNRERDEWELSSF